MKKGEEEEITGKCPNQSMSVDLAIINPKDMMFGKMAGKKKRKTPCPGLLDQGTNNHPGVLYSCGSSVRRTFWCGGHPAVSF